MGCRLSKISDCCVSGQPDSTFTTQFRPRTSPISSSSAVIAAATANRASSLMLTQPNDDIELIPIISSSTMLPTSVQTHERNGSLVKLRPIDTKLCYGRGSTAAAAFCRTDRPPTIPSRPSRPSRPHVMMYPDAPSIGQGLKSTSHNLSLPIDLSQTASTSKFAATSRFQGRNSSAAIRIPSSRAFNRLDARSQSAADTLKLPEVVAAGSGERRRTALGDYPSSERRFQEADCVARAPCNVHNFVMASMKKHRNDHIALVDAATGQKMTCSDVMSLTTALAAGLRSKECQFEPGDVLLATCCEDVKTTTALFLAVAACGGKFTMLPSAATRGEIAHCLRQTGATVVVTDGTSFRNVLMAAISDRTSRRNIFCTDEMLPCKRLSDLIEAGNACKTLMMPCCTTSDDVVLLAPSCDVMDTPHFVQLTHGNVIANWNQLMKPETLGQVATSMNVVLGLVPVSHVFGLLSSACLSLINGCTHVTTSGELEIASVLNAIDSYRANVIHMLPTSVGDIPCHPLMRAHPSCGNITVVVYGTMNIFYVHRRRILTVGFQDVIYLHGYVETASVMSIMKASESSHPDSVGRPLPETRVKVVINGRIVGRMQIGDVYVRGPQSTKLHYLNSENRNLQKAVCSDGWMRTGDCGWYDDKGILYLRCRRDFNRPRILLNIVPRYIESLLLRHPAVADVSVVAIPEKRDQTWPLRQELKAVVATKPLTEGITAHQLHRFGKKRLLGHNQMRWSVDLVETIPRSSNGRCLYRARP